MAPWDRAIHALSERSAIELVWGCCNVSRMFHFIIEGKRSCNESSRAVQILVESLGRFAVDCQELMHDTVSPDRGNKEGSPSVSAPACPSPLANPAQEKLIKLPLGQVQDSLLSPFCVAEEERPTRGPSTVIMSFHTVVASSGFADEHCRNT